MNKPYSSQQKYSISGLELVDSDTIHTNTHHDEESDFLPSISNCE